MRSIYKELLKATKVDPEGCENDGDLLREIHTEVLGFPDSKWAQLSEKAKEWWEENYDEDSSPEEVVAIDPPPGFESPYEDLDDDPEEEDDGDEPEEKPKRRARRRVESQEDEEDEEEKPRRGSRRQVRSQEEEEEKPKRKTRRKAVQEEEDEPEQEELDFSEEEEEVPAARKRERRSKSTPKEVKEDGRGRPRTVVELPPEVVDFSEETPLRGSGLFTARATTALGRAEIVTIGDLLAKSDKQLRAIHGAGINTKNKEVLAMIDQLREMFGEDSGGVAVPTSKRSSKKKKASKKVSAKSAKKRDPQKPRARRQKKEGGKVQIFVQELLKQKVPDYELALEHFPELDISESSAKQAYYYSLTVLRALDVNEQYSHPGIEVA